MRYRLRTLLILLALGPPVLAGGWGLSKAILKAREHAALQGAIEKYRKQCIP